MQNKYVVWAPKNTRGRSTLGNRNSIEDSPLCVDPNELILLIKTDRGMPNPPEIQYSGSKAFYSSITDRITLPLREIFISPEEFLCDRDP